MILRTDSAYYGRDVVAAARRGGSHFSITARKQRAVAAAISATPADSWVRILYPKATFDEELNEWVSDAEVAETPFTAFVSRGKVSQVTARLIVRRVCNANPAHVVVDEQGELFAGLAAPRGVHRLAAAYPDRGGRSQPARDRQTGHRRSENGSLAHLPPGNFIANSGLVLAAMAFNLTRAVCVAAGGQHAKTVTATIRPRLIIVAGRIVRTARRATLRLPTNWPWANGFTTLLTATIGPPATS